MKKTIFVILALVVLAVGASADWQYTRNFISTAIAVNASATKTNGSDFTSAEQSMVSARTALLTVTFTRTAGSATLTCDFYFQVSHDGGTTWSDYVQPMGVETGHAVISGTTVRVSLPVTLSGVSHIRLAKIINNDSGNNLTAVNASISW